MKHQFKASATISAKKQAECGMQPNITSAPNSGTGGGWGRQRRQLHLGWRSKHCKNRSKSRLNGELHAQKLRSKEGAAK